MSRATTPVMICDDELGVCTEMVDDWYETGADSIGGYKLSPTERAEGWLSTPEGFDYCPKCRSQVEQVVTTEPKVVES